MSETVRFPQLNHTNYAEWALRMEAILIRGGFWDLITGDEKLAEDGSDTKAFRKREAQCKAEIVLRVEDSQLPHMADRSPMVVWNSLANVHRARGFGSRLQLRRNFITASMKESQSMESWIGEVRGLANRLKAIDVNVSDEDMIVVLTAGLPTSYTPIVISFDALEGSKLTLDFVITRLLNEEGRQATPSFSPVDVKTESSDMNSNTALNISKFRSDVQCFYCLQRGHYSSVCPQKEKDIKEKEEKGRKHVQVNSVVVADVEEEEEFAF
jgi:gag-polypeptide of LTR copia-type